jgi:putative FmdB family regulatory protein
MPIYEYQCRDCEAPFEALVTASRPPSCPTCHGTHLAKLLSAPGMVGVSSQSRESCAAPQRPVCGGGTCGCAH